MNDPVTGKERLRLDPGHVDPNTGLPYNLPNARVDHVHPEQRRRAPEEQRQAAAGFGVEEFS